MVLLFFPRNAKALFRKAVALKKLNRFSEALTSLEEASLIEPSNKDIIQELEVVRQSLAVNKNGKRVITDSLNVNDVRGGKVLVSPPQSQEVGSSLHHRDADMVELKVEASSPSSQLDASREQMVYTDCDPDISQEEPTDIMDVPQVSQAPSSTTSTSSHLRFTNKKRSHNALHLSSQDYENLLHGKTMGYYHPRSMTFMRVRTLTSKTIQTGTPQEVISGTAEVPISSPLPENLVTPINIEFSESVELEQEEVIKVVDMEFDEEKVVQDATGLQIAKKKRVLSGCAQVSKLSSVYFQFIAVKDTNYNLARSCRRRVAYSYRRRHIIRASTHTKKRASVSVNFSLCLCRYTKEEDAGVKRVKRKGTHLFHFDELYPPYKKSRLSFSVSNSCNVTSVCWLSSSLQNSDFRRFVL